ncbi:MAG: hypothetical protein HOF35_12390, partial [Bacteroidetes bacterium]|nr:hypothetical protein [Bacteroidota bacterium]
MLKIKARKYLFYLITYSFSILLMSCAQNGCPGGMCAPNHYYSSPKSIWSSGVNYKSKRQKTSGRKRNRTRYKKPKSVRNIEYNQRWNKPAKRTSANIEGGGFRSKRSKGFKSANIEGGTFRTSRTKTYSANIEGGSFRTGRSKSFSADIESSPFKVRRSAKRRTNKAQRAIRYKEPKDRKGKRSKYGLFEPEIEGWEKRDKPPKTKTRKNKEGKEGHG